MMAKLIAAVVFLLALPTTSLAAATTPWERNQLWLTVSLKCMRHLAKSEAPIPCDSIDNSLGWDRGVALLKDEVGAARMLAVPTHPVTGIEDPAVLTDDEPNYFAVGWASHFGFPMRLHALPPPHAVGVVVESKAARRQDQLSLIVDCLNVDVSQAVAEQAQRVATQWREGAIHLGGRSFWARRVDGDVKDMRPFRLLAEDLPGAKQDMAAWSLALLQPASFEGKAFMLLAARDSDAAAAQLQNVLDPTCAVAAKL